jgi:hypothetical protein
MEFVCVLYAERERGFMAYVLLTHTHTHTTFLRASISFLGNWVNWEALSDFWASANFRSVEDEICPGFSKGWLKKAGKGRSMFGKMHAWLAAETDVVHEGYQRAYLR